MCRKVVFTICFLLVACLAAPVPAAELLAGYEPSEVDDLTISTDPCKDPDLWVTWPLEGGVNDVPEATEGGYVLELEWADDNTVEIRHDWNDLRFDLEGQEYILVDVYFGTESALPEIIGIWDDIFGWVSAVCVPCTAGEWYTLSFYVGNLNYTDLDHIFALKFENTAGNDGTIYIDNLRLGTLDDVIRTEITFAGYNWMVKDSGCGTLDPGSNYFSHSKENVWVDDQGRLHLKIAHRCDKWFCSEVVLDASLGYGTYIFTTDGRVDLLDPNVVLGLFTWDTDAPHHHYREIDIEFSRWWDPDEPNNAQYVVQPWDTPGNMFRFKVDMDGQPDEITTHEFTWLPDRIDFLSYFGDFTSSPPASDIIESWSYTGDDVPPAGGENVRMNFWLLPPMGDGQGTARPTDGNEAEIVIKAFSYRPVVKAGIRITPRTLNLASKGRWVNCRVQAPNGYWVSDIDASSLLLEDEIEPDWSRLHGRRRYGVVKFSRPQLVQLLADQGRLGNVQLTVTGRLTNGSTFEATDTIRVINKGKNPVKIKNQGQAQKNNNANKKGKK